MTLLFKMLRTLVTFSLTSILKLRVPDIHTWKGTCHHKTFEKCWKFRKIKFTCELLEKKDKVQVPQQYEMLSIYCIILGH